MRYSTILKLGVFICSLGLSACNVGYQKTDGKWAYVTWDEAHGTQVFPLPVDTATFKILENEDYALDKNNVFWRGIIIPEADGSSFVLLEGENYGKDKNHVFLLHYKVINADPNTFVEIEYPYAKDKKNIFCGTLPMHVQNIDEFEVTSSSTGYSIFNI